MLDPGQSRKTCRLKWNAVRWFSLSFHILSTAAVLESAGTVYLFNLNAEYIKRNTGLDKAQAGIKIARKDINNLRCEDDTTLMAESEEELKSLLRRLKSWFKTQPSEN